MSEARKGKTHSAGNCFNGVILEQQGLHAHDELGTCRGPLAFPDRSLLSLLVPVRTASLLACLAITQHISGEK